MKVCVRLALAALVLLLTACATPRQANVALSESALNPSSGKVGIAMAAVPAADSHLRGAHCLLCMAAASLANNKLTAQARTFSSDDLAALKGEVTEDLRKKSVDAIVIPEPLTLESFPDLNGGANTAKKDFSSLKKQYGIDKLIVIQVLEHGVLRTYSGYIATSDPKGWVSGVAYLVNLKSNAYEWYLPVQVAKSADKTWDEPPQFPGVTNAYYQAVETAKDRFRKPFLKQ